MDRVTITEWFHGDDFLETARKNFDDDALMARQIKVSSMVGVDAAHLEMWQIIRICRMGSIDLTVFIDNEVYG